MLPHTLLFDGVFFVDPGNGALEFRPNNIPVGPEYRLTGRLSALYPGGGLARIQGTVGKGRRFRERTFCQPEPLSVYALSMDRGVPGPGKGIRAVHAQLIDG